MKTKWAPLCLGLAMLAGCGGDDPEEVLAVVDPALVGRWAGTLDLEDMTLNLLDDGTFEFTWGVLAPTCGLNSSTWGVAERTFTARATQCEGISFDLIAPRSTTVLQGTSTWGSLDPYRFRAERL